MPRHPGGVTHSERDERYANMVLQDWGELIRRDWMKREFGRSHCGEVGDVFAMDLFRRILWRAASSIHWYTVKT